MSQYLISPDRLISKKPGHEGTQISFLCTSGFPYLGLHIKQPRVLGVDDWAYRKGVSYGTILIDMETSRPIDILPSRNSQALKDWLVKFNDVKIVTRDRASSYSSVINEVCPNAVQIADRFHLLIYLSDTLDTYFKSISTKIKSLITIKT